MTRLPLTFRTVRFAEYGNGLGYARFVQALCRALEPHVDPVPDAPLSLTVCSPMDFTPTPGQRSVLFTMYESPDFPVGWAENLRLADVVVVPSEFNRRFVQAKTPAPVYVCPLGVEPLPFTERQFAAPFRWLWVNAFNLRKGWQTVATTWDRVFGRMAGVELYVKTTPLTGGTVGLVETYRSLTLDSRVLPEDELAALYASAHAFVYPTLGEGFGLTLAEAMTAGLPCVATDYGGHRQFATPKNCVLVPAEVKRLRGNDGVPSSAPDGLYAFGALNPLQLGEAMLGVMRGYDRALMLGREAARYLRTFTWERTAARLMEILRLEQRRAQAAA